MRKALFLDRDGIFNEAVLRQGIPTAPRSWEEIKTPSDFDGELLGRIKKLGFLLILVTNQPDVERGKVTRDFVEAVNRRYKEKYALDAVYYCPFASNDHPLKKPNPGMFLRAAEDLSLTLSECFHLGDTDRDIGAASRCGCRSLLWNRPYNANLTADFAVKSLQDVCNLLAEATGVGSGTGV